MRNQLVNDVNLLFSGNPEASDLRDEILQNTLDRYDDLLEQGKTPEAAYGLAISSIGDVGELLGRQEKPQAAPARRNPRKLLRAVAIALYILCPVPLFLSPGPLGLSLLLVFVATATALLVFAGKNPQKEAPVLPEEKLYKSISNLVWTIGTVVYLIVSFVTFAWHITWIIFLILGAVDGIVKACIDLRKEN